LLVVGFSRLQSLFYNCKTLLHETCLILKASK
jgi:hypothetical protein